jgi:hypothetical protein
MPSKLPSKARLGGPNKRRTSRSRPCARLEGPYPPTYSRPRPLCQPLLSISWQRFPKGGRCCRGLASRQAHLLLAAVTLTRTRTTIHNHNPTTTRSSPRTGNWLVLLAAIMAKGVLCQRSPAPGSMTLSWMVSCPSKPHDTKDPRYPLTRRVLPHTRGAEMERKRGHPTPTSARSETQYTAVSAAHITTPGRHRHPFEASARTLIARQSCSPSTLPLATAARRLRSFRARPRQSMAGQRCDCLCRRPWEREWVMRCR